MGHERTSDLNLLEETVSHVMVVKIVACIVTCNCVYIYIAIPTKIIIKVGNLKNI